MILTSFAQLTYVNVLHWIVRLYYYGFLVNEGIGFILVIQTFDPSTLSVLYNNDIYHPILLYDPLPFLLVYLNHIRLTLSYHSYSLCLFTLLIYFVFLYLCTLLCVYILLLLSYCGCSQYILLLSIIPSSFGANHII